MTSLYEKHKPIDLLALSSELKADKVLKQVGGEPYLSILTNFVPTASHVKAYAELVEKAAVRRRLIKAGTEIVDQAYEDCVEVEDLVGRAEKDLFEVSDKTTKSDYSSMEDMLVEAFDRIDELHKNKGVLRGLKTGFRDLDKKTAGLQKGDLIIIGARPAMGKTAFVLSMIKNIAVDGVRSSNGTIERIPCAMFSLEMSMVQLVNRLIINVCRIPGDKIKSGQLTKEEWMRLDAGRNALQGAPIYLDETPQLSVLEFRTKAMRLVSDHGIKIIFIDYLQLMNAQGMNFFSREGEVSLISRSLKGLAKELKIPIIALSQLNRNTEKRDAANAIEGRKPQLADLRESGAIEQDADIVAFIHRPEYYKIYQDTDGTDLRGVAQLLIAKHRNGSTEDINLRFRKEFAQFLSNSDNEMPPMPDMKDMIIGSRTNNDQYSNYDEMLNAGGNGDVGF